MTFIAYNQLQRKIVSEHISAKEVFNHFDTQYDEILYVVENENQFIGIITPGDFYRYICFEKDSLINTKATTIDEADCDKAEEVFQKIKSLHEVPVVRDGIFRGIMSNGEVKSEEEWKEIRRANREVEKYQKNKYRIKQLNHALSWLNKQEAAVYVIEYPSYKELGVPLDSFKEKKQYGDGINGFLQMPWEQQKHFFGDDYYPGKPEQFAEDFNKLELTVVNGRKLIQDVDTEHFKVCNGHRIVPNAPHKAIHKAFLFGPCNVFGSYSQDNRTIGYYLQDLLNLSPYDYEVVISAKNGGYEFDGFFCEEIGKGDIVVFFANHPFVKSLFSALTNKYPILFLKLDKGIIIGEDWTRYYYNCKVHHGAVINKYIAQYLFHHMKFEDNTEIPVRRKLQDYFIDPEIFDYYYELSEKYRDCIEMYQREDVGAIVMNCNPFTLGHQYLIERAASQVSLLWIFVVEEDKSVFKFADRFEMVKRAVAEMQNDTRIMVVPSGEYIISNKTFSQYFDKEKEITEVKNMDYDVHIFGDIISDIYHIGKRFVGEELTDVVTRQYNETMRKILPDYNIEVIEIPRAQLNTGEVISATHVRRLINDNQWNNLIDYVPSTTLEYINSMII